jgi:hypothetical protein
MVMPSRTRTPEAVMPSPRLSADAAVAVSRDGEAAELGDVRGGSEREGEGEDEELHARGTRGQNCLQSWSAFRRLSCCRIPFG